MTPRARIAARLAALSVCAAMVHGQDAPEPAPRVFADILWVGSEVERSDALFAAIRRLGFTAVTVSAQEDPTLPAKHGMRFLRDQLVGKGVLELREPQWHERMAAYEQSRDTADLIRPACLADPAVLEGLRETLRANLAAALPEHPLAVSLGDEISVTRHANPLDFCFSSYCRRAFRQELALRYPDVAALNRAWRSSFGSMDDVVPFTADRIRARELGGNEIPAHLGPWAEHLEFQDAQLAAAVGGLAAAVRRQAPDLPCGLTGMQPPSAYGGHDYRRLMPLCSFYEAYDIGGARDLAMSFAPPGARQVTTLFPPAKGEPLQMVRGWYFDALAHGMAGIVGWSASDMLGRDGKPTPYGKELAHAISSLRAAADVVAGAELIRSPVWLIESQAAVRAHWMLDSANDGRTWIRRLSSYEREHSTSLAARHSWLRLFEDLGLQARIVAMEDLPARLLAEPPRLLVLPVQIAISDEAAAAITAYTRAGGVLLADHGVGFYDEHLVRREQPALDGVFGVRGRSVRWEDLLVGQGRAYERGRLASGAAAAEVGLSGPLGEPTELAQVQIENTVGEGRAVYLNLAVCEYGRVRLDPSRVATALDLRRRVRLVLEYAGVAPEVSVRGPGLPTCIERMELRTRDGRRVLAVRMNALESRDLMRRLGAAGARPVQLVFPRAVRLRDLVTGTSLGQGESFDVSLDPWQGLLLEMTAP
jgi:hypothetical protein